MTTSHVQYYSLSHKNILFIFSVFNVQHVCHPLLFPCVIALLADLWEVIRQPDNQIAIKTQSGKVSQTIKIFYSVN